MAKCTTLQRAVLARTELIGVRKAANESGISAATLSRVQRGNEPDLKTFRKICLWLEMDPAVLLDIDKSEYQDIDRTYTPAERQLDVRLDRRRARRKTA